MKTFLIIIISFLLLIVIGSYLFPILYFPEIKHVHFHNVMPCLFIISFAFILCGWLTWLIYKIELNEKMLQEKENEANRENIRQKEQALEAITRSNNEINRNRVNDLIRIAQISTDKTETSTPVKNTSKDVESKEKEKIVKKLEGVNLDKFSEIFKQYQSILSNPTNE